MRTFVKSRILALCAAAALGGSIWPLSVSAGSQDPQEAMRDVFVQGNSLYESGDYEGAIEQYTSLLDAGVEDKDLYYNLANASYKTDELGEAVLYYERALRISPRDIDARDNLALVRSQLKDKQFVRERNRFVGALLWLHHNFSTREMVVFASCCYLSMCLLGIVFVFRGSNFVSAAYRRISFVSLGRLAGLSKTQDLLLVVVVTAFLCVSAGISAYKKTATEKRRQVAVVLEREVPVFSSPVEDTTLQFKIHEGTIVKIRERRLDRVRIQLPGGLSGWVAFNSVGRV